MTATIVDLHAGELVDRVADLLYRSFRGRTESFPDLETAQREVVKSLDPRKISRVALDPAAGVVGWIGAIPQYRGRVWELHPLVIAQSHRRRGIGRALVSSIEATVALRGATTLWLGTDDEIGETSLSGVDLYADVAGHLRNATSTDDHALLFYRRLGFHVVGCLPDANGRGKPDIFMAKRIGPAVGE